ncbi:hypothetical protein FOA52_007893 [Chlamydomonas sp. UWO 241]|nr:hypothetical protein FOA52_007893 [Chlamydomonas sp. UWO 241]
MALLQQHSASARLFGQSSGGGGVPPSLCSGDEVSRGALLAVSPSSHKQLAAATAAGGAAAAASSAPEVADPASHLLSSLGCDDVCAAPPHDAPTATAAAAAAGGGLLPSLAVEVQHTAHPAGRTISLGRQPRASLGLASGSSLGRQLQRCSLGVAAAQPLAGGAALRALQLPSSLHFTPDVPSGPGVPSSSLPPAGDAPAQLGALHQEQTPPPVPELLSLAPEHVQRMIDQGRVVLDRRLCAHQRIGLGGQAPVWKATYVDEHGNRRYGAAKLTGGMHGGDQCEEARSLVVAGVILSVEEQLSTGQSGHESGFDGSAAMKVDQLILSTCYKSCPYMCVDPSTGEPCMVHILGYMTELMDGDANTCFESSYRSPEQVAAGDGTFAASTKQDVFVGAVVFLEMVMTDLMGYNDERARFFWDACNTVAGEMDEADWHAALLDACAMMPLGADGGAELETILTRCLSVDPSKRPDAAFV